MLPVEINAHAFIINHKRMILSIARNISERVRIEKKLNEYRCSLEKLIIDRTDQLNVAKKAERQAQKRMEISEERFRLIAENLPLMVWTALPNGIVDYFSSRWYEYTGQIPKSAMGWGWKAVLHPDDYQKAVNCWKKSVFSGTGYEIEYRLKCVSDGKYRWFIARGTPLKNEKGSIVRWFGYCTDIEELKKTQDELKSKTTHLERSNKILKISKKQLKKSKELAEAASQAKSYFLANVSHELRTPLNSILGYTQLMKRESTLTVSQQKNIEIITRSGEHLLNLINNVLEMAKIEAGSTTLNKKSMDLFYFLSGIEEMMKSRAINKGLEYNVYMLTEYS